MMNNELYLRRRNKIVLPPAQEEIRLPANVVASMLKNIEALGYTFSAELIEACHVLSMEQLTALYQSLIADLKQAKGIHQKHKPMYPNFPEQVMEMSRGALYLNAIVHYLTGGRFLPATEIKERFPLLDKTDLQIIALGTQEEFEGLFGQIVSSNTSLSEQDKADVTWFIETYGSDIATLLPDALPQKETMAFAARLLVQHTSYAAEFLGKYCRTATDVLRLAVAMSGGDVSLAAPVKFRSFKRNERNLLLGLLERQPQIVEDMLRWKNRWIRLGERLHPGEYARKYPRTAEAFRQLRNDVPIATFNSKVETVLAKQNVGAALELLASRAGDFARRLDHLLRSDTNTQDAVIAVFGAIAEKVSTPVLLQVLSHFQHRNVPSPIRVFFPKGNVAKAYALPNELPPLSDEVCEEIVRHCEQTLTARFAALPPLGKTYLDPALARFTVPFSQRSASKSLRTLTRGSRLPLPEGCKVLRFFVWWKNGRERTDIDLSAAMFDTEFQYKDVVAYYNLKNYGGCHSGDIVDAPKGASEFIDITIDKTLEQGVRYVVMSLTSYTQQPYCDLPECFAGWMARQKPKSGEIYEPITVQDRLDITADTRIAIPLIIDLAAKEVIWCDMALRRNPRWQNHVQGNLNGIAATLYALTHLKKPTLYDLFRLHTSGRGELVDSPEQAETVFSAKSDLPFRLEEIAANYLP